MKSIICPAPPGAASSNYAFNYGTNDQLSTVPRPFVMKFDPTMSTTVSAPLLTSIDLPDGTHFSMKNSDGTPAYSKGDLLALTLPTLGRIEWSRQQYQFPTDSASHPGLTHASGVQERRLVDPTGTA